MSAKETVFVVDDDESARELLVRRLEREGFDVVAAADGLQALDAAEETTPQLVILDIGMPTMDGHETVRRLRADARTALVPVLFLTCRSDPDEKIAGFQSGADDYVVKPYDGRELMARVRAILDRNRKLRALSPTNHDVDQQKLECLKHVVTLPRETLAPSVDSTSPFGHRWGAADSPFPADPERQIAFLEDLVSAGCLQPEFFDTIHLCKSCRRYNLNFREVCPVCGSPDIEVADLIHHFRCAFVAPVSRFLSGTRYVCPKCDRELRHIGVDYEKPSQSFACRPCGAAFREPEVACACLACGAKALATEERVERLYAYRLTAKGRLAAESGHLYDVDFARLMEDGSLEVLGAASLQPTLQAEVARSRRFGRPLSLLVVTLEGVEEQIAAEGRLAVATRMRETAQVLRGAIRETDVPCRFGEHGLACILPETTEAAADTIATTLRERLASDGAGEVPVAVSIAVAGLDTTTETEDGLLGLAIARLEEERRRVLADGSEVGGIDR
ncbi:MAG: response regulator [Planctomycetes bacterium]|nr:response regulator [Planctomycetota bacterium]MBI3844229.1 response regulator [Planctomycetota bacterium]